MGKINVKVKGIVEHDGQYLLIQKWYDDNFVSPYKWEFIDHDVEPGKAPDDIIIDSVEMGMGLRVESSKPIYTWSYSMGDEFRIGIAYLCHVENDIVVMSDEYSRCVWVKPEEFCDYIEDEKLLDDLRSHNIGGLNEDIN